MFLAITLWFYVAGEQNENLEKKIPLNIKPPQGMIITKRSTSKVDVLFRGSKNRLASIPLDIAIYYEIKNVHKLGEYNFSISSNKIDVPSGVKVVHIKPSVVTVTLDKLTTKWLAIKPNVEGKAGKGYRIVHEKIKLNPNISLIEGPEKILKGLDFIYTSPIRVRGYTRSFTQRVSLEPLVKGQLPSLDIVEVVVPIEEEFVNKNFKEVPVNFLVSSEKSYSIHPSISSIDIILTGRRNDLDELNNENILAFVDVTDLNPGKYELPVQIKLPNNIFLLSDVPLIKITVKDVSELPKRPTVILPAFPKKEKG